MVTLEQMAEALERIPDLRVRYRNETPASGRRSLALNFAFTAPAPALTVLINALNSKLLTRLAVVRVVVIERELLFNLTISPDAAEVLLESLPPA